MSDRDATLSFVRERRVLRRGDRVLIATGGGVASVAMMLWIARHQATLGLAAISVLCLDDGTEDGGDRCFEAARVARERSLDVSVIELAGRSRNAVLRSAQRAGRWTALALGHTVEDAAARVLRELIEGTTIRGLAARRRGGLARPLLAMTLREADALAAREGVEVVLGASHALHAPSAGAMARRDEAVRSGILPRIRAVWPDADRALSTMPQKVRTQPLRQR